MVRPSGRMQLAFREWQGPLGLWLGLSGLATLAGPFGTMEALTAGPRTLYWFGVTGVAIGLDRALTRLESRLTGTPVVAAAMVGLYAVIMASLVFALNTWLFESWGRLGQWLWLLLIVLAISAAVHALMFWLDPATGKGQDTLQDRFLARLRPEARGALIRIEAQDHYLLVVTRKGQDMILMRMGDAEAELGALGQRVHRSHWIAPDAIVRTQRAQGQLRLLMADGTEVPVSRGYRDAARKTGLLPG